MYRTMKLQIACAAASLALAAARTSKSASALRGRALLPHVNLAAKEVSPGTKDCPCIGFRGTKGEIHVQLDNGTKSVDYPAELGSYCNTWDMEFHPDCQGDAPADWCGGSWCFVDACSCRGLDTPPKQSVFLKDVIYQGMPLYYSYKTCGSQDTWTQKNNFKACANRATKEECENGDKGEHDCMWAVIEGKEQCAAWEAAGLCMGLPEHSPWGNIKCPCIGWNGVNGTIRIGETTYPADLGSICQAWDAEHSPQCQGDDKAEGCDQPWCFVDSEYCNIPEKPQLSTYLPDATFQGRALAYSYETCGGKRPQETTTTTTTASVSGGDEGAKEDQKHEEEGEDQDDDDEDDKDSTEKPARAIQTHPGYDTDAYADEWNQEYHHGAKAQEFREKYPHLKGMEDRQSDGVPSPVTSQS